MAAAISRRRCQRHQYFPGKSAHAMACLHLSWRIISNHQQRSGNGWWQPVSAPVRSWQLAAISIARHGYRL